MRTALLLYQPPTREVQFLVKNFTRKLKRRSRNPIKTARLPENSDEESTGSVAVKSLVLVNEMWGRLKFKHKGSAKCAVFRYKTSVL